MWILWKGKLCDILVQRAIRIIAVIWEDSKHCWFADKPVIQILKAQEQSQEKKKVSGIVVKKRPWQNLMEVIEASL